MVPSGGMVWSAMPTLQSNGDEIRKIQNDFLEIRELAEASYLYYKGNEIKKLIPEIGVEDYFENKIISDEEIIFKFKDGTYGRYNYIKNSFCRTNKMKNEEKK